MRGSVYAVAGFCPGWHRELVDMLTKGDPEEAARFLEDHLLEVVESMEEGISGSGFR